MSKEITQGDSDKLAAEIIRKFYKDQSGGDGTTMMVHACIKIIATLVLGAYDDKQEGLRVLRSCADEMYSEAARNVYGLAGTA